MHTVLATERAETTIPEHRTWVFTVSRLNGTPDPIFVSVHSTLPRAVREAQAHQGTRRLEWVQIGRLGKEEWTDQRRLWRIARTLLDP